MKRTLLGLVIVLMSSAPSVAQTMETRRTEITPFRGAPVEVPLGTILPFSGISTAQLGDKWMPCDGRSLRKKDFEPLYGVIGVAWGRGDNAQDNPPTTFNLPDLQGMFLRGVAHGKDTDPDRNQRGAGFTGYNGNSGDTVGSLQKPATAAPQNAFTGSVRAASEGCGNDNNIDADGDIKIRNCDQSVTVSGGGDHETRPINAYVEWIIRVK